MVSRLLGKLEARRHLISGAAWAKAGALPAARMPAMPDPAMNFLRSMKLLLCGCFFWESVGFAASLRRGAEKQNPRRGGGSWSDAGSGGIQPWLSTRRRA